MGLSISISNSILSESMTGGLSPVNIVPPVVSGIGLVGQTLSSTTGTWSGSVPISYSYQWKRNGSPILGANSSSYLLVTADGDTDVTCTVTATNTKGSMSSNSNSIAVISYDPNAYAFFQATGITDPAIKDAVDILVKDLKLYNIWSKMKAIYPFVGGTATTHKFNLVNPADTDAAFRLAFNGGWTHSSNGATPNGVNGFANTNLIATNILTNNSTHLSFYSRTNVSLAQQDMGVQGTNPNRFCLELSYLGSLASDQYNFTTGRVSVANANSLGYYIGTRTTSSIHKVFKNNAQIGATNTGASAGLSTIPLIPIYIGVANNNGNVFWSTKQVAFATIGDGLTDEDSANLYYSVQKFQTTLGRQVGTPIYSSNATDVNARLFLGATNIQDATITSAVDTLVQGLKTDGIWSKLKAVYPFVGGTATTHKFNLANALDENTSFRMAFNGGWTHDSNGATPNGTNGYANTFFNPLVNLTASSSHATFYSRTNFAPPTPADKCFYGLLKSPNYFIADLYLSNYTTAYTHSGSITYNALSTGSTGLIMVKNSAGTQKFLRNDVTINTSIPSGAYPNDNIFLNALNLNGTSVANYSPYQCAFASFGDGLTDTDASNLYTRVQAFQTTLNRQV